jgi:hypothetical protein
LFFIFFNCPEIFLDVYYRPVGSFCFIQLLGSFRCVYLETVGHGFIDGILDSPPKKKSPGIFFLLGGIPYIYIVILGDTGHGRGSQKEPGE